MKQLFFFLLLIGFQPFTSAQNKQFKVGVVGFYNFENLFDTEDDPEIRDEEYTPTGKRRWTEKLYNEKLDNMAKVVADMGAELSPDGAAILGVCEIENRKVLEDFVKHPKVADRNYKIVHYDSPDERGIDVALIYNPRYFVVTHSKTYPVMLYDSNGERDFTRDVLLVSGIFDGEPIHLMVNHWPSRSGGEKASQHRREAAARVCKMVSDSILKVDEYAKIMIMGDLNDDPISPSVKNVLQGKQQKSKVRKGELYNPWWDIHRRGFGTLAYRDSWNLFDQIIVSHGLITRKTEGYKFHKANILNKKYLVQKNGRYKGYPFRTFGGDNYLGGYSDHFPVYVYLLKEI
jgi:endonuclease/exonuclease/phosphatase family metal-dependent hydrolase